MITGADNPSRRLAALQARLDAVPAPEPPTGPFRDVDLAVAALVDVVEALPFAGHDQRVRAREILGALPRQLHSLILEEDSK